MQLSKSRSACRSGDLARQHQSRRCDQDYQLGGRCGITATKRLPRAIIPLASKLPSACPCTRKKILDSWQLEAIIYKHDLSKRTADRAMKLFAWVPVVLGLLAWQLPTSPLVSVLGMDGEWLGWALPRAVAGSVFLLGLLAGEVWTSAYMGDAFMEEGEKEYGGAFAEVVHEVRGVFDD